jgi:Uma2 family endonuclease
MTTTPRFTSADLEFFPLDNGKRYEIIDGELYVSRTPHLYHQFVCSDLLIKLGQWSVQSGNGRAVSAPGLIFADDNDVVPDIVWMSWRRMATILGSDGKLHGAPKLVIEVLSPGPSNEQRDRETKLKLYSRRAVDEYWIVDWTQRRIEVFRREKGQLQPTATLLESEILTTPLLPTFTCPVAELFQGIPKDPTAAPAISSNPSAK